MRTHSLPVVIRTVDDALLLLFLQDTRDDCLNDYADAAVVYHSQAKCVQPLRVDIRVSLQQTTMLSDHKGSGHVGRGQIHISF